MSAIPCLIKIKVAMMFDQHTCECRQLSREQDTDPRHVLCVLLILERARGPSSEWAPYIDILPQAYGEAFWRTEWLQIDKHV